MLMVLFRASPLYDILAPDMTFITYHKKPPVYQSIEQRKGWLLRTLDF